MTHTLPVHAQEVWWWNLFKVYTWQQELFDGTTTTFETVVQEDAVLMIVVHEWKIIVAKEFQPHFTEPKTWLLGWRLPWGEDPLSHAKVELLEEAGMVSDDITLLGKQVMNWNMKRNRYHYVVKNPKIVAKQSLDVWWETLELMAIGFEEFIEYVLHWWVGGLRLKCTIQEMIIAWTLEKFKEQLFN
jgi:hypothetical protein